MPRPDSVHSDSGALQIIYLLTYLYANIRNRIFLKNLHIAYFSAYYCIFKIAWAEIMLHMGKFALCHIFCTFIAYFSIYFAKFRIFSPIFCIKMAHIF